MGTAFIISSGFAALGVEMKMWFMIWGHNCLKKRRSFFAWRRKPDPAREGGYRDLATDNILQPMVEMLNRGGAGLGSWELSLRSWAWILGS